MRKYLPLIIVVSVAAIARLLFYSSWSFSNDELSALTRLDFRSFGELISEGVKTDGHPAFVQVFLYYYTEWAGNSSAAVRLPFILAGIASVLLHFLIARRWFGEKAAILSSLVMALLQFPVLYSQLARPYSFGLLWVLLSVYFWDKLLFREKGNKWLFAALAGISYALAMYTHYFSFLAVLIVGVTGLFYMKKQTRLPYLLSGAIAVVLFVPHIPVTLHHLTIGGVGGWLAKPEPWWLITHLKYVFNDSWMLLLMMLAITIFTFTKTPKNERWSTFHTVSLLFFGLLFLTGFLYSVFVNAVIQHSTMLFGLPFILMLLFSWVKHLKRTDWLVFLVGILLVIPTKGLWSFYSKQHFGEFEGVAERFAGWNQETDGDVINVVYANSSEYLNFYLENNPVSFNHVFQGSKEELAALALDSLLETKDHLILAWTKPYRVQAYDIVRSHFPRVSKDMKYGDLSRITMFSKSQGQPFDSVFRPNTKVVFECKEDFSQTAECVKSVPQNYIHKSDSAYYQTSKKFDLQFSKTFSADEEPVSEIEVTGKIYSEKPLKKAMLVFALAPPKGKSKIWRSIPLSWFTSRQGWNRFTFTPEINTVMQKGDELKIHLWNPENERLFVDDLQIILYEE